MYAACICSVFFSVIRFFSFFCSRHQYTYMNLTWLFEEKNELALNCVRRERAKKWLKNRMLFIYLMCFIGVTMWKHAFNYFIQFIRICNNYFCDDCSDPFLVIHRHHTKLNKWDVSLVTSLLKHAMKRAKCWNGFNCSEIPLLRAELIIRAVNHLNEKVNLAKSLHEWKQMLKRTMFKATDSFPIMCIQASHVYHLSCILVWKLFRYFQCLHLCIFLQRKCYKFSSQASSAYWLTMSSHITSIYLYTDENTVPNECIALPTIAFNQWVYPVFPRLAYTLAVCSVHEMW